jgi:hypothetical protein
MDYIRYSARISLTDRIRNEENKNGNEGRHITGNRRIAINMLWPCPANGVAVSAT